MPRKKPLTQKQQRDAQKRIAAERSRRAQIQELASTQSGKSTRKKNTERYEALVAQADKITSIPWFGEETLNRVWDAPADSTCGGCGRELKDMAWAGDTTGIVFCNKGCITRGRRDHILANIDTRYCGKCQQLVPTDKDFVLNPYGIWHLLCVEGTKNKKN